MTVRITQLSDTHFLADGAEPEGGGAYDTGEAFEAVLEDHRASQSPDLVVVTGDIADHGAAAEYSKASTAFARFDAPVNACPGNHDLDVPYSAGTGGAGVSTERVVEMGEWTFLFVDSCAGHMIEDADGQRIDPPGDTRLHTNGGLGALEASWIREAHAAAATPHVFIWLHHPPSPPLPLTRDDAYAAEWNELIGELVTVRGLGGGHTHVPDEYDFHGRPVFVAPSLKNNFSMEPQTWLPPGYRTYDFADDGSVTSEVRLVDDERWPRRPFGRTLRSLFDGEITHDQLAEIVAQRQMR